MPCSLETLQNRRLPIVAFSLHVYWRVNRSLDNPVRMDIFPLVPFSDSVASCRSKALPLLSTVFTMIQMQHKGAHDLCNSRKYRPLLRQKARCNACSQPMYATIESEVLKHLIRTFSDDKHQSCKY